MTIQTNLNDRKELARRLIPFNHNEKLRYTGTPAFAYEGRGVPHPSQRRYRMR